MHAKSRFYYSKNFRYQSFIHDTKLEGALWGSIITSEESERTDHKWNKERTFWTVKQTQPGRETIDMAWLGPIV
jgi:hypothetical protein